MITARCIWTTLLLGIWCTYSTRANTAQTLINCQDPIPFNYPDVYEGHTGILERVKLEIPVGESIGLESPSCPVCLSFLDLIYTPGDEFATVNITKPLDAEALPEYNGNFSYSIVCLESGVNNTRTILVKDINDNAPIFEEDVYKVNVSEYLAVGSLVVQVKATDADVSPDYNTITYSIQPPSDTFEVTVNGSVLLKKQLNYTATSFYSFKITATDAPIQDISPPKIKAYNGYNSKTIYSIGKVHPNEYWENGLSHSKAGVNTVQKKMGYEKTNALNVGIEASLENDKKYTASTMVEVEVKNVNDPPVFSQDVYTALIDKVVPIGYPVVVVKATDPDAGETEMLQYSLMEPISSLFAVEPSSGQVYVVSDIKDSRKETLKVKATDPHGLYNTTTVEVTVVIDTSNVVKISINKPAETVMSQVHETERALQRGLGLEVKIVNVTNSSSGDVLARTSSLRSVAVVSFVAMDTGGTFVSSQDVKTNLKNNEEKVQAELREVYGADTQFDIIDEGKEPGTDNTVAIVLGTIAAIIAIASAIFAGIWTGLKRRKKNASTEGMRESIDESVQFEENITDMTGGRGPSEEEQTETKMKRRESIDKSVQFKRSGSDESIDKSVQFKRRESIDKSVQFKENTTDMTGVRGPSEEEQTETKMKRRGSDESIDKSVQFKGNKTDK